MVMARALIAPDHAFRQPIFEPTRGRAEHLHMLRAQAGFFVQLAIHRFERRLVAAHSALRKLPAVPVRPARPEHPPIITQQDYSDVWTVAIRVDHVY